jgi:hypothetical protein
MVLHVKAPARLGAGELRVDNAILNAILMLH